jgi:hypothetical protein
MLLIAFSPSKALGQISTFIFLAGLIFYVQLKPQRHILIYTIAALLYTFIGLLYLTIMSEFSLVNHFLFLVTASSPLILLYDLKPIASPKLMRTLSKRTLLFLALEGLYGITQAIVGSYRTGSFDIDNGDVVRGTIEPSFVPATSGGNAIFAILISTLFMFTLSVSRKGVPSFPLRLRLTRTRRLSIRWIGLCFGGVILVSWVLASVLHTIIYAALAVVLTLPFLITQVIPKRTLRQAFSIILVTIVLGGLTVLVLPRNISHLPIFLKYNFSISENSYSEKARATYYTFCRLPKQIPLQPIVGLGPGQYSSRASLIRSGEYLRVSIPISAYVNPWAERYILRLLLPFKRGIKSGSSLFPHYSWLTAYGETGLLGFCAIILLILKAILDFRKLRSYRFPKMHWVMLILVIYIALLGLQDNYWEFTQAIFPAFLILALCHAYLEWEREKV